MATQTSSLCNCSISSFEHFAPQELTERDFISVGSIYIGYSNEQSFLLYNEKIETKPANVEEAIKAGWRTAKEMYECAGVCRDTFNEFILAVRNAVSNKPNSGCRIDPTANLVVKLGSSHKAYISETKFQLRKYFRN